MIKQDRKLKLVNTDIKNQTLMQTNEYEFTSDQNIIHNMILEYKNSKGVERKNILKFLTNNFTNADFGNKIKIAKILKERSPLARNVRNDQKGVFFVQKKDSHTDNDDFIKENDNIDDNDNIDTQNLNYGIDDMNNEEINKKLDNIERENEILKKDMNSLNKLNSMTLTAVIGVGAILLTTLIFGFTFGFSALNQNTDSKFDQINANVKSINERFNYFEKYNDQKIENEINKAKLNSK